MLRRRIESYDIGLFFESKIRCRIIWFDDHCKYGKKVNINRSIITPQSRVKSNKFSLEHPSPLYSTLILMRDQRGDEISFYHSDTRGWCGTIRMHGMNFYLNNKTRWLNKTLTTIISYVFPHHETNDLHRSTMTCVSPPGRKTYHTMNNDFPRKQIYCWRLSGFANLEETIYTLS